MNPPHASADYAGHVGAAEKVFLGAENARDELERLAEQRNVLILGQVKEDVEQRVLALVIERLGVARGVL